MGKNLHFLPECHSTNLVAFELSRGGAIPEGTLVITENQTAGRGQRGNIWTVEKGMNLTFSLVVYPKFIPPKDQFLLSQAVSLGIYDFIRTLKIGEVKVKWPNDIMVNGRKVCGILIENQLVGGTIELSVIGIGLNVNQTALPVPTASSLKNFRGFDFDLEEVLEDVCHCVEVRYLQLRNNQWSELREDYRQALYWRDESRTFFSKGQNFSGMIRGTDEQGRLQLEVKNELRSFDVKEILYLQ